MEDDGVDPIYEVFGFGCALFEGFAFDVFVIRGDDAQCRDKPAISKSALHDVIGG